MDNTVTVRILDREYRVRCAPEQRRDLMESALLVDQQMREIRDGARINSLDKVAVISALNLAEEVIKLRQALAEHERIEQRLGKMAASLEASLPEE